MQDEIQFREGLIGLPQAKRFQLLVQPGSPIRLLRSLDVEELYIPVVDPFLADPNYRPPLGKRIGATLGLEDGHDVLLLVIATLQKDGPALANLRAPLVINATTCTGVQVILDKSSLPLRAPVAKLEAEPAAQG